MTAGDTVLIIVMVTACHGALAMLDAAFLLHLVHEQRPAPQALNISPERHDLVRTSLVDRALI